MADIKQAAKWMQEGKRVTRRIYTGRGFDAFYFRSDEADAGLVFYGGGEESGMYTTDLLADDWEIVQ